MHADLVRVCVSSVKPSVGLSVVFLLHVVPKLHAARTIGVKALFSICCWGGYLRAAGRGCTTFFLPPALRHLLVCRAKHNHRSGSKAP